MLREPADEIYLVEDDHRGPVVEGLLSRLLASGRIASLCGLSAVVESGKDLAEWLGIDFLEGTPGDRPVVLELRYRVVQDLDKGLKGELRPCFDGGQSLVFCSSRRGGEETAGRPLLGRLERSVRERMAQSEVYASGGLLPGDRDLTVLLSGRRLLAAPPSAIPL